VVKTATSLRDMIDGSFRDEAGTRVTRLDLLVNTRLPVELNWLTGLYQPFVSAQLQQGCIYRMQLKNVPRRKLQFLRNGLIHSYIYSYSFKALWQNAK